MLILFFFFLYFSSIFISTNQPLVQVKCWSFSFYFTVTCDIFCNFLQIWCLKIFNFSEILRFLSKYHLSFSFKITEIWRFYTKLSIYEFAKFPENVKKLAFLLKIKAFLAHFSLILGYFGHFSVKLGRSGRSYGRSGGFFGPSVPFQPKRADLAYIKVLYFHAAGFFLIGA